MVKRSIQLIITLTLLLFAHGFAHAQDAATQEAKRHFDIGQSLYLKGKFMDAAKEFEKAYQAKPFAAFLFNGAVCHEKNKNFAKALELYRKFLAEAPTSTDRSLVKKRISVLTTHLNPQTPSSSPTSQPQTPLAPTLPPIDTKGVMVVESSPEGAAIYLNSKKNGVFTRTPFMGSLPPGRHTIILELKEFAPVRKTIVVKKDVLSYLYFSLARQNNLGWIEVKGNIPHAQVYLDKKKFGAIGTTPYSGHLRPGKRTLIIERPGFETYKKEINIIAGKTHVFTYQLNRVSYGWLKVTGRTTKGATVFVDDKPFRCETKGYPCRGKIDKGKHRVRLEKDGFKSYETTVEVEPAHQVQVAVRLNKKPSRVKAYITLGVSAALLGTGIAFGVMSNNKKNELQDDLAAGNIYHANDSRISDGRVYSIVANAAFAASGIALALGTYYLFRKEGPESYGENRDKKFAIMPIISPQITGLSTEVRF